MNKTFTDSLKLLILLVIFQLSSSNGKNAQAKSSQASFVPLSANWSTISSAQHIANLTNTAQIAETLSIIVPEDVAIEGKNYYWVPFGTSNRGSGSWSELGHWATSSGGIEKHTSLPTAADNVIFDANSFQQVGQKITFDVEANAKNITWTGIRYTQFDGNGKTLNVHGSLQAHTNVAFTGANGLTINFKSATEDTPINFAGRILPVNTKVNFEGSGSWILQNQLNTGQGGTISLNEGTLKTNNQTILANTFNSEGTKVRALQMGSSTISNLNTWNVSSSLQLSFEGSKIVLNGTGKHLFYGGYKAYGVVVLHGPEAIIYHSNTFKELATPQTSGVTTGTVLVLESGQTQTIETLSTPGTLPFTTIQSSTPGNAANFNFKSFRFCTDYLTISDVTANGTGNYYAGLSSTGIGNTSGWNFTSCGVMVYAPKATADYDTTFSSIGITTSGNNQWQELRYNNELVGAIKDGGNILEDISIEFTISSDNSRAVKSASATDIKLLPRNWRIKAKNAPNTDKPVSIRLYTLQRELEAYKVDASTTTTLADLFFTTYSSEDSTENCAYLDNLAEDSTTALINNRTLSTASNYFTAELTGITEFTEFYLHNGTSAIDFVASQPVKEEPVAIVEEMDFTAHWNAKTVKLKWMAPGKITASYDVERASSPESKEFETIISKAPRQNSANAATAVYHAEDFSPAEGPDNYYRLKRTNADGTFTYSQTVKVDNKAYTAAVQASPNPFTDKVKLTINAEKAGEMSVKLMTEYGEVALEKKIKVAKGTSESELVIGSKVKAGIYLLVTELNGERLSRRLIKQ